MHVLAAFAVAVTLSVPDRTNATPTVAAEGRFVTVVWGATLPSGVTDIFAAVSRDGPHTFGPAVRVNHIDGDARVNGEQPPRIALVKRSGLDPSIVVVWTTKGKSGTRLVMARSIDGGATFSPATTVPDSDAAGTRGWHTCSMLPMASWSRFGWIIARWTITPWVPRRKTRTRRRRKPDAKTEP